MKIKKKLLEKVLVEADDDTPELSDLDANSSASEIADNIQASVEIASGGEETVSDTAALKAGKEAQQLAKETNAIAIAVSPEGFSNSKKMGYVEDDPEILGVENKLTKALDLALRVTRAGRKEKLKQNINVLVPGLPGSGKTAVITDWARSKGLNLFLIAATDPDLEAAIYGITLRDQTAPDKNQVTKAVSTVLNALDRPNSVLFLDEFNRAKPHLRRALLTLVNEQYVLDPSKPEGTRHLDNLLFTIAAYNPGGLDTDINADLLTDAEKSRFPIKVTDFNSDPVMTADYLTKHWNYAIAKLSKDQPDYLELLEKYLRIQDIGIYLVTNPNFHYDEYKAYDDDRNDTRQRLSREDKVLLNQRLLTDGLIICQGDVELFKEWVEYLSGMLEKNKTMILNILSNYKEPTLQELLERKEQELKIDLAIDDPNKSTTNKPADKATDDLDDEDDFDFDSDVYGEEDDEDAFSGNAKGKVSVTPYDVEAEMDDFLNSI